MSASNSKQPKVQDYACVHCTKRFHDLPSYETHLKMKHTETKVNEPQVKSQNKTTVEDVRPELEKPKVFIKLTKVVTKPKHKNKGSQQMQQDAEDKIYAFLGELGVKHVQPDSQQENVLLSLTQINQDDDRMMGQANYLENNIVRTPFEVQLDVKKEVESIEPIGRPAFDAVLKIIKDEVIALNEKLSLETEKWEFRDPIEMEKEEEQEFSLINIPNVLNNYRKKGLDLQYPHFSVFLLWLAKICKALSWKEFFLVTAFVDYKFDEHLRAKPSGVRSQASWKSYFQQMGAKNLANIVGEIEGNIHVLNKEQVGNFIDLYEKWVCYFDPF